MRIWEKAKGSFRRIKGAEWALLLVVLGLAGSFLLTPGGTLFQNDNSEKTVSLSDPLEARIAAALSCLEGAGKVEVIIHYATTAAAQTGWLEPAPAEKSEPVSAIVLAEGADSIKVRLELGRAVQTLLKLSPDDVEIFKMGSAVKEE